MVGLAFRAEPLVLHAAQELGHDAFVERVADAGVLDSRIDGRVVVDLDHGDPVAGLLEVDTVQAVADRRGRAQGEPDHVGRHLVDRQGLEAAGPCGAFRGVVVDLPVAAGHEVLACVQRLAVQHADAPVELGEQVFLGDHQRGTLEQLLGLRA